MELIEYKENLEIHMLAIMYSFPINYLLLLFSIYLDELLFIPAIVINYAFVHFTMYLYFFALNRGDW